jgi:hypothetical protein
MLSFCKIEFEPTHVCCRAALTCPINMTDNFPIAMWSQQKNADGMTNYEAFKQRKSQLESTGLIDVTSHLPARLAVFSFMTIPHYFAFRHLFNKAYQPLRWYHHVAMGSIALIGAMPYATTIFNFVRDSGKVY